MSMGIAACLCVLLANDPSLEQVTGTIEGVVMNASQDHAPVAEAEVILQVLLEGKFAPVETTRSDALGRFHFDCLPVGPDALYLPGATRDGIFYPGRRIEFSTQHRTAYMTIPVHDSVRQPNPLVIREHEIVLRAEGNALQVVESMLIENPVPVTYVGDGDEQSQKMSATFRLGIPANFRRLTFEKEFYGRAFQVIDGQVVTTIPWTPGQRSVRFTYTIVDSETLDRWEHRWDVPCEHLLLRVQQDAPEKISCSLGPASGLTEQEAVFQFDAAQLAGVEELHVTLSRRPRSWNWHARWIAVVLLLGAVSAAAFWRRHLQRRLGARRLADDAVTLKIPAQDHHAAGRPKDHRRCRRAA